MASQEIIWQIANGLVKDYAQSLANCGLMNPIMGMIRNRNHRRLTELMETYGSSITEPTAMKALLQIEGIFSKNPQFTDPSACETNAWKSFNRAERLCRITNRRLDHFYHYPERLPDDLRLMIDRSIRWIESTLGPTAGLTGEILERLRLTSGASFDRVKSQSLPHMKVSKRHLHCSSGLSLMINQRLAEKLGYGKVTGKIDPVNRIVMVPKSWKTHRTIAAEPRGTLPQQLAVDSYVKERLALKRIDLRCQDYNQRHALRGSVNGDIATIDMSMASDTVAYNTVAWLFPMNWFVLLCSLRSEYGMLPDGNRIKYAKFSSMGNGSTFVVETLIFSAFCHAAGSREFRVYGDDIAIETECVPALLRLLKFFGFTVNAKKSHWCGPFRESCGRSYIQGVDVTPYYVRTDLSKEKIPSVDLVHVINGLLSRAPVMGHVWEIVKASLYKAELPLVPFNADSRTGIFIDVNTCYTRGILRANKRSHWIARYKGFLYKRAHRRVASDAKDERSLFLWHLNALKRAPMVAGMLPKVRSVQAENGTLSTGRFRLVSRTFVPSVVRTPPYVFYVGEFLSLR